MVENPALPEHLGHLELLDIPGRWGRTDAYGRGRQQFTTQRMTQPINVYVDGSRIGGAELPNLGINGCAAAQLRFGADQDGGQRISAEVDRSAIFPSVLADIDGWQQLAFGQ